MLGATAIAVAALLAGCGGADPSPSPTGSSSISDSPTPTPTETAPPPAAERDATTPFDRWDAYLACRNLSWSFFIGPEGALDFGAIDFAAIDASEVVERTDGLWYVYIEVINGNGDTPATQNIAAECILGGTLGEPRYELFGARTRAPSAERDPNSPLPTG